MTTQERKNIKGLVSIYTPTYNTSHLIKKVYESVKSQKYTNWEWVICDDGSKPKTRKILKKLQEKDARIKLFYFENSGNIGKMKKRCTERCSGEYLVELDHDDQLTNNCLEEVVKAFKEHPDAGMTYSNCTEVTDDGDCHFYEAPYWDYRKTEYHGKTYLEGLQPNFYGKEPSLAMANSHYWELMPNHVRAFRASTLFELGGYDDTLIYADDYDVILRMFLHSKIVHIPKMLYLYRWGDNTWTSDKNADLQQKMSMVRDKYFPEVRLDLGCGNIKALGFQGVDIFPHPEVDHVLDFNKDGLTKFEESSVDIIRTIDFIEHIKDKVFTLEQIYRALKHNGTVYIQVPSTDGRGAFQDPTHVSYWNENSFHDMYMNGIYRYGANYNFFVDSLFTTETNDQGVCWVRVTLRANKEESQKLSQAA